MFFSNFDHSWESYLDDFIEKAHAGLTLAWGCGVGFPPTRYLVQDGASYGQQVQELGARLSMAVSRFWYSAYPDLTVDQMERNHRITNDLRKASLQDEEAVRMDAGPLSLSRSPPSWKLDGPIARRKRRGSW